MEQRVYGRRDVEQLETLLGRLEVYPGRLDGNIDRFLDTFNHQQIQLWIDNEEGMQSVRTEVQRYMENLSEVIAITKGVITNTQAMISRERNRMSQQVR